MKAKEAHNLLFPYKGDELYQKARKLLIQELDNLITLRSYGKPPSRNTIQSALEQTKQWFLKVAEGLSWSNPELPQKIFSWTESSTWIKHKFLDPKVENYRKQVRLEILKGSPLPLFTALTSEALDAMSGMMIAQLSEAAGKASELLKRRKTYAEKLKKKECFYGTEEKHCLHQETYWMKEDEESLPTSTEDLVFVCTLEKCIKGT